MLMLMIVAFYMQLLELTCAKRNIYNYSNCCAVIRLFTYVAYMGVIKMLGTARM